MLQSLKGKLEGDVKQLKGGEHLQQWPAWCSPA